MSADLAGWLREAYDAREQEAQMLLAEAQQALDLLRDHQPQLLGRMIPGWHAWPDVKRTAEMTLAEVAANRRLLELHPTAGLLSAPDSCGSCAAHPGPCDTLRLLAQPYAGREGWREKWQA
jgi:hypothetical protein